jgi:hypothetical protein
MTANLKKHFFLKRGFSLLLAFLFTLIVFNWAVPTHFDADTVLQSVMSMQKVTLFYWGQDRYANFLPFLYSWIPSPRANLLAIYFTSGLTFFLLLELISDLLAKLSARKIASFRLVYFLVLSLVSLLVLNKKGIYTFAYAAQPYSMSFLLMGWSWLLICHNRIDGLKTIVVFLLMFVAVGINPSIMLITWATFVIYLFYRRNWRVFILPILATGLFFFWQYLSSGVNAPHEDYSKFSHTAVLFDNLKATLNNFSQETERLSLTFFLLGVSIALFLVLIRKHVIPKRVQLLIVLLTLFALFWWCLFSMSDWATRNNFHFRYFFPSILILLVLISMSISYAVLSMPTQLHMPLAVIFLVLLGVMTVRPIMPMKYWHSSGGFDGVGRYMDLKQARILAGGYWQVWPALFRIQSITSHKHTDGSPRLYGAAFRGSVNKSEMDSLIIREMKQGKVSTAVCIGAEPEQCVNELVTNTSFKWTYVEQGHCGITKCHLLQVQH